MSLSFRSLSLSGKITFINALGIVLVALSIAVVSVFLVKSEMQQQAQARQEANMRVAWEVLRNKDQDIRLEDGALFAGDHRLNDSVEVVDRIKELVGGTATVFMGDQRVSTNVVGKDGKRAVGTRLAKGPVYDAIFKDGKPYRGQADILGSGYFTAYDPIISRSGEVIGVLYVGLKQSEFLDIVAHIRNNLALISAALGLIAVVVGFVFMRRQLQPLGDITGVVERLRAKELDVDIPAQDRHDEIGTLAKAIAIFRESMVEGDRLADERHRQDEARSARATRIEELCNDFDSTSSAAVKSVAAAASQMQSSSKSMSTTASESTRQTATVAAASEQASANVQAVATAAEELSSSISEISRQVAHASQIATSAVKEAEQTNQKVQGLAEASSKIGEVVALITDIADQTNLLALNATIEAARAGDAGKGFAVVASEVKNLANQTAKATDEIGTQIGGIQTATQEAVAAIEAIAKTIAEIDEVNSSIASAVEQQGAATQEIARNVEQAAAGTEEVSSNITGVSQAANDTGAAAEQIHAAAGELSQQSETLRDGVDRFLADVRSA